MGKTYSVCYHPTQFGRQAWIVVVINTDDDEGPVKIIENFADVGASVIWMIEIPTIEEPKDPPLN